MRKALLILFVLALALPLAAQKRKKPSMPEFILRAQTVTVVQFPGTEGVPIHNPREDRDARFAVEDALRKWGRYAVVFQQDDPDLIIVLRKGGTKTRIKGEGTGSPPVDMSTTGDVRIGAGNGPTTPNPPHMSVESGPAEDMLMVYLGHGNMDKLLDGPPIWRFAAKNALNPPAVTAVQELRKAVEAAEKKAP